MFGNHDRAIKVLACIGLAAALFTGLELGIRIAAQVAGVWGIVVASALFPATIAAAPLLALTWGQWTPAVVVYGGGFAAGVLYARRGGVESDSSATR
ncbi:MAG: hypothetical protein Q8W45_06890 [Candidatus Palauibacterales bacterium]|nr:hypothetical protein [Candidatus Palauibacterales bacterium]MDP2482990.1 hypothetical protein [Candidatus Palauibacterales bacterium]